MGILSYYGFLGATQASCCWTGWQEPVTFPLRPENVQAAPTL
jgi:hypothetical protein